MMKTIWMACSGCDIVALYQVRSEDFDTVRVYSKKFNGGRKWKVCRNLPTFQNFAKAQEYMDKNFERM